MGASELGVLSRTLTYLQPSRPSAGVVAIAYAADNPASRADAESIAALLRDGLRVGNAVLRPKLTDTASLASVPFSVVIAASGAAGSRLGGIVRDRRGLCVTADVAAVEAGTCTMAISAAKLVSIVVNHAVSVACGIEFASAFRMMIREI